jgi:DNA-binding response OmpR family regulator
MSTELRPASAVREESSFPTPPRVRVVADDERVPEAVALAEALDGCGADAEVRLVEDAAGTEYDHVHPDAIVIDLGASTGDLAEQCQRASESPVLIAVTENDNRERGRAWAAGFDMVVTRPVDPSELIERLGDYLFGART